MRKLILSDVAKISKFMRKTNTRELILDAYSKGRKKGSEEDGEMLAAELFFKLFEYVSNPDVADIIYDFFAGIIEITPVEAENIPLDEFADICKKISAENNMKSFLEMALK